MGDHQADHQADATQQRAVTGPGASAGLVRVAQPGWIQTYNGRVFFPTRPRAEDVPLTDIAHALSLVCRFSGHCRRFYSVAEHSVWVSRMVPAPVALWGLLHDAAEAYLADVARPVKPLLTGFDEVEERLLRVIAQGFGLEPEAAIPDAVKHADLRMLETERQQLMAPGCYEWGLDVAPYSIELECWAPVEAEGRWLARFQELAGRQAAGPLDTGAPRSSADAGLDQAATSPSRGRPHAAAWHPGAYPGAPWGASPRSSQVGEDRRDSRQRGRRQERPAKPKGRNSR